MRKLVILASFGGAQILVFAALLGPIWNQFWISGFRNYFPIDQLSYAAIARNVSDGEFSLVEPFTQTGSLFYPSLWYQILGFFSRVSGLPVHVSWNLLGIAVVSMTVGVLGIIALKISRRSWAPLLPSLILCIGTLATVTHNYWYASLESHAVLWGGFGTFFTLNAEVVGLCLNGTAFGLLALVGLSSRSQRSHFILLAISGGLVGITASIQTYNFFSGVALLASWACAYALLTRPSIELIVVTSILLVSIFIFGPTITGLVGHVPGYGLLLLVLAPGAIVTARNRLRETLALLVPLTLLAMPQVARTALGISQGDPFLLYRQDSTAQLSVPIRQGLIAGAPILLIVGICLLAFHFSNQRWLSAALLGSTFSWAILSLNDHWGFSQEPYRLWIQGFVLTAMLSLTLLPLAISDSLKQIPRSSFTFFAMGITAGVVAISFLDFRGFWIFANSDGEGVLNLSDSRARALSAAASGANSLVASGPCINPQIVKLVSGSRVAYENLGLAWGNNHDAVQALVAAQNKGSITAEALRAAQAGVLLTDSACDVKINFSPTDHIAPEQVFPYSTPEGLFTITRWRVSD